MLPLFILFAFLLFFILLLATAATHILLRVPYVPTKTAMAKRMVEAAKLRGHETVFDLGCGDGRLLFETEHARRSAKPAPHGAKSYNTVGFEIAPLIYLLARTKKILLGSRASIRFGNFFNANLRGADVIFCYLFPNIMPRLAAKIKAECKPGTRIISNTFHIPGLPLARVLKKNAKKRMQTVYVYEIKKLMKQ